MFLKDRRRHHRFECTGHAEVLLATDAPLSPARVVNVCNDGCLIEFIKSQKLDQDTAVELAFKVNRLPFRIRALAVAIRSETAVGFEFTPLSERVRCQVEELIEELASDWRKRLAAHRWHADDL